jgi:hypothetical protein
MQGCLAGRVRPTNAIHLLPSHRRSLDTSGAIEDTSADEAAQTGNTETAVRDTGRNNYVAGNRLTSIVERDERRPRLGLPIQLCEPDQIARSRNLAPSELVLRVDLHRNCGQAVPDGASIWLPRAMSRQS